MTAGEGRGGRRIRRMAAAGPCSRSGWTRSHAAVAGKPLRATAVTMVDGDGDGLSVAAGQRRRTAGENCGFEVDGDRRGGSEATMAEDAGFGGGEAAANGNTEPGRGG